MKRFVGFAALVLILFLAFLAVRICVRKVPIGFVGVRSNLMKGGIEPQDLGPGYHVAIPGLHRLQLMDARRKLMTMGPTGAGIGPEFQLIAKDQFTIGLDVSIVYSLEKGTGYKAIQKYGEGAGFVDKMKVRSEKILTETLGQLTTEEFFDPEKRTQQARLALDELNRSMQDEATREFLVVYQLLIRNVSYDPKFEQRLLEKQILDQEKSLYESEAKKETELEKTQLIEKQTAAKVLAIQEEQRQGIEVLKAQTDAEIARIEADAKFYADTALADADRYKREKTALGDLERALATAKGDKAVNAAYTGLGGQLLLVKKMIQNVTLGDIEINTNRTNPFDVADMLGMLGADVEALPESDAIQPVASGETAAEVEAIRVRVAQDEAKAQEAAPRGAEILEEIAPTPDLTPATDEAISPEPSSEPAPAP